jgi:hypothetical protein
MKNNGNYPEIRHINKHNRKESYICEDKFYVITISLLHDVIKSFLVDEKNLTHNLNCCSV